MEWSNPGLIDLQMGGTDANKHCKDGGGPPSDCIFGGALNYIECNRGGEIVEDFCVDGTWE